MTRNKQVNGDYGHLVTGYIIENKIIYQNLTRRIYRLMNEQNHIFIADTNISALKHLKLAFKFFCRP